MVGRILSAAVFGLAALVVSWFALVHTVHLGTLAVPDLRGMSLEQARQLGHDRGLLIEPEEPGAFSTSVPAGLIAGQDPHSGFHVKTGATVRVRLSLGGERITVPDLRAEALQGALRILEQGALVPGRRAQVVGQVGADRVIASEPPVGSEVAPETPVNLLVNVTPARELWVMPSFLSRPLASARRFCRSHHLRVGQIHETAYPGFAPGLVLRQYPAVGSPLSRSDIITLWVSQ